MKKVIAIDGPSGAGKSTIAREVAKTLGFLYLDTGALYRAIGYYFFKKYSNCNVSAITEQEIEEQLKQINIEYEDGRVFLSRKDISTEIRAPEIGYITSVLSAKKVVRDFLLPVQRRFAEKYDIVAEGRDMTTVVFPDAWKKFYLDASAKIRAIRRFEQLKISNINTTFEEALQDVMNRDIRDSSRENAPLTRTKDAFYIDTSNRSKEEVISIILKKVAEDD